MRRMIMIGCEKYMGRMKENIIKSQRGGSGPSWMGRSRKGGWPLAIRKFSNVQQTT